MATTSVVVSWKATRAPRLPITLRINAKDNSVSARDVENLVNVLQLYFTQLDNASRGSFLVEEELASQVDFNRRYTLLLS